SGIEHLEQAMKREPRCALQAFQAIYEYLIEAGRPAEAKKYLVRAEDFYGHLSKASKEWSNIRVNDVFEPPDLTTEQRNQLLAQLETHVEVATAYVVKKFVRSLPQIPFYVIGIVPSTKWFQYRA